MNYQKGDKDRYYQEKYRKYKNKYRQLAGFHDTQKCNCISCLWYKGEKLPNGKSCGCHCHCKSGRCDYKLFSFHCGVCKDKSSFF